MTRAVRTAIGSFNSSPIIHPASFSNYMAGLLDFGGYRGALEVEYLP